MSSIRADLPANKLIQIDRGARTTKGITRRGMLSAAMLLPVAAATSSWPTDSVAIPYPSIYGAKW